jgi:antitoxin HicB
VTLKQLLKLEYPLRIVSDPDGGYVADYPDLPGCVTVGETLEEIEMMARDARESWLTTAHKHGIDVPAPHSSPETAAFSGQFRLRLPKTLHRKLSERADSEGVSLNTLAATLIAEGLGARSVRT